MANMNLTHAFRTALAMLLVSLALTGTAFSSEPYQPFAFESLPYPVQGPPPVLLDIDGELHILTDISSNLVDSNGQPWLSAVSMTVRTAQDGFMSSVDITPDANGHVQAQVYVPFEGAFTRHRISFWGDPSAISLRGPSGPFLTPSEGTAAHHMALLGGDQFVGASASISLSVLSPPPLVAGITIQPPSIAGLRIAIADGDRDFGADGTQYSMPWSEDLSIGTTSLLLYSWSNSGFWDCVIENSSQFPLVGERLLRGSSTQLQVPPQVDIQVSVDLATFPLAKFVIIVEPNDHKPNPAIAIGSDISWLDQKISYSAASANLKELVPGTLSRHLLALVEGCYVQIWGWDSSIPGDEPSLIAWQLLPGGVGPHTLTF